MDLIHVVGFHLPSSVLGLHNHLHNHVHGRRELCGQKHCLDALLELVSGGLETGKQHDHLVGRWHKVRELGDLCGQELFEEHKTAGGV